MAINTDGVFRHQKGNLLCSSNLSIFNKNESEEINVYITRDEYKKYGCFSLAMKSVCYNVKKHKITDNLIAPLRTEARSERFDLSLMRGILSDDGDVEGILSDSVYNIVNSFVDFFYNNKIQGVYIPPTACGTFYENMITHIDSGYHQTHTANAHDDDEYVALLVDFCSVLAAKKLNMPILGSCHGAQILWYMHGEDLYSLPSFSSKTRKQMENGRGRTYQGSDKVYIHSGAIKNRVYKKSPNYTVQLTDNDIKKAKQERGYESDEEEEIYKDYNHNLLMVTDEDKLTVLNAKRHPIMSHDVTQNIYTCKLPDPEGHDNMKKRVGDLPVENGVVVRSFVLGSTIGLQWHPHKNVNTKSSVHYLSLFGRMCLKYKTSAVLDEVSRGDLEECSLVACNARNHS